MSAEAGLHLGALYFPSDSQLEDSVQIVSLADVATDISPRPNGADKTLMDDGRTRHFLNVCVVDRAPAGLPGHEGAGWSRGTHEATEDVDARERGREDGEAGEEARAEAGLGLG